MNSNPMLYDTIPAVAGLNKVPGFDPRKFLRKTSAGETVLDLKYKKLWFRLVHPQGRIKVSALKITEQIAIIEAKIYFSKDDAEPVSSFIAQRAAHDGQGQLYIEAAQYAAVDQALEDASFGLQFCDGKRSADPAPRRGERTDIPALTEPQTETSVAQQPEEPAIVITAAADMEPPADEEPASIPVAAPSDEEDGAALPNPAPQAEVEAQESTPEETPQTEPAGSPEEPAEAALTEEPAAPPAYTAGMAVDEICERMTLEDAGAVVVDVGTCKDWTLSEVFERRPASLKWYMNGYTGDNNILRAGAKLLLEQRAA